jgi:PAS domain S-box-containing protein
MHNDPENIQDSARASLTLLYNISRELASITDLRTTLARVLLLAGQTVGAERGSLVVLDAAAQPVDAAMIYKGQVLPHTFEQLHDILDKGLAGWVYRTREAVLLTDTRRDARWLLRPDDAEEQSGAKSAICVPVMENDVLLGVLTIVHPRPRFFTGEHLTLVRAVADLAAIAVRNAQLYDSLNEARRRYYEVFEDSFDPIFITDWEGHIVEVNRQVEKTTGYSREELRGSNILDLHPEGMQRALDRYSGYLQKIQAGQVVSYESQLTARNGRVLPVQVHVRQVNFEATQNLQWLVRDISERKHFEALQEDLSSMIYHDLRSPLSNVFSSLEMMEGMLPPDGSSALKQVVNIALRSTERVQRLINSLLDIRRLEAGQPITNRRWVEVRKLFEDVLGFVQPAVVNKRQHLILEIEGSFPPVWVDGDMIRRVLVNLLENGGKFTAEDGSLYTGARLRDEDILFWVRDTGAGISPEIQEKIFDKFISVQSGNTGRLASMPKGLGLGLAFCRLAVQAHGGKIWVVSTPEVGSTFFFTLPIGSEPEG